MAPATNPATSKPQVSLTPISPPSHSTAQGSRLSAAGRCVLKHAPALAALIAACFAASYIGVHPAVVAKLLSTLVLFRRPIRCDYERDPDIEIIQETTHPDGRTERMELRVSGGRRISFGLGTGYPIPAPRSCR